MRTVLAVLLGVVLAGCATREPTPTERAFRGWVEVLASPEMEGRGAGTAGLDKARDVLVAEFASLGLEPGFRGDAYTQALEIPLATVASRAALAWSAGDKGRDLKAGEAYDFSVLGFSGDGEFSGEAVFVGYAINEPRHDYDSLAGQADLLRGRVAIAWRYEPMGRDGKSLWGPEGRWTDAAALTAKAQWAHAHGAVALLIVNPSRKETGGVMLSTQRTSFGDAMGIPVYQLRDRVLEKMVGERSMRAWEQEANERGAPHVLKDIRISGAATIEHRAATIHNVCAVLPGIGELKDEVVIVGAHYDHLGYGEVGSAVNERVIHPGADDNASGTAAVVMLAERWVDLAQRSRWGERRTLVFVCFSGEERGTFGSMHFVTNPDELTFDLDRAVAMVNFDMVGRVTDDKLDVMGAGSGDRWLEMTERAGAGVKLDLNVSIPMSARTDHVHFHQRGIATLHLFSGLHEDYHRPSDTASRVNAAGGAAVVDFADALLGELVVGPALRFVPEPEGGYTSEP